MIYLLRYWKQIALVLACAYFLIAAYGKGAQHKDAEWSARWAAYERQVTADNLAHEKELRELQTQLNNVNQVNDYAQHKINQLETNNTTLSANVSSLRDSAKKYAATIKRFANNPAFADTGKTTATGPDLLAELFGKSVERNQQLAVEADRYRIAGLACERAYATVEGLINKKSLTSTKINE